MAHITDVSLNQLKLLSSSTGSLLLYDSQTEIILYYVNQGPVIFRTILIKDPDDQFLLGLQHLPKSTKILTPIKSPEPVENILKEIKEEISKLKRL